MINKYFAVPYVNGGRDMQGADCWGLTRLARLDLHPEKPCLPMLNDLDADDKRGVTKQFYGISNGFHESGVVVGAIACAFIGVVCVHVGLVVMADGRIRILETDTPHGVSCTPIAIFEGRYTAVKYYDN